MARMWPVDGVVGENGAFYFHFDEKVKKLKKRFQDHHEVRARKRRALQKIKEKILTSVPGSALAGDQAYREADLAIDYCEDVPSLDEKSVDRICRIFEQHGATCRVSSIHVNGWFGEYDKLKMTKIFVQERWALDLDLEKERFLYCGDSPNDESMFAYFPYSIGVKNVLRFKDRMGFLPAFITEHEGGEGFAEVVEKVLHPLPGS